MNESTTILQREFAGRELAEQTFNAELSLIIGQRSTELAIKALSVVHPKFYIAPASVTGKYHPLFALGDGGLVRHTKAGVYFLQQQLVPDGFRQKFTMTQIDQMIIALLLHDTCKSGLDWENEHTANNHAEIVVDLQKYMDLNDWEEEMWGEVNFLIASHMGQWGTRQTKPLRGKGLLYPATTEMQLVVHMCDFLSSRPEISLTIFGDDFMPITKRPEVTGKNGKKTETLAKDITPVKEAETVESYPQEGIFNVIATCDFANNFQRGQSLEITVLENGKWLVDGVAEMEPKMVKPFVILNYFNSKTVKCLHSLSPQEETAQWNPSPQEANWYNDLRKRAQMADKAVGYFNYSSRYDELGYSLDKCYSYQEYERHLNYFKERMGQ